MTPLRSSFSIRSATAGRESPTCSPSWAAGSRPSFESNVRILRSRGSRSTATRVLWHRFDGQSKNLPTNRRQDHFGLVPATNHSRARVPILGANPGAAKKIALQILDLHGGGSILQQATERIPIEENRAAFQQLARDSVPN